MNQQDMDGLIRKLEVTELLSLFYSLLDTGSSSEVIQLFSDKGVWNRKGQKLTGAREIKSALDDRISSRVTCHVITNMIFIGEVSESAKVKYILSAYDNEETSTKSPRLVSILECTDNIKRVSGVWKIEEKNSKKLLPIN